MTPRLLLTVGTCLIAASGFAANLQPIQEQVRSTSDLVDQVADRTRFVVAQSKLESSGVAERSRQSRLENGEVLFLLGHHEKAVVVLFDLVDDPDFKGEQLAGMMRFISWRNRCSKTNQSPLGSISKPW